ncbi:MAG: hypothetical protein J6Y42_03080 [Bacilli bacterium]|nr:hypothetical protein [Bacilli bacterium]
MNKSLEALERITNHIDQFDSDKYIADKKFSDDYITIEKELKEGELAITYTQAIFDIFDGDVNNGDFIIDIIAKQKKALEIIREFPFLILLEWAEAYDEVNNTCYYDLLKEVL